MDVLPRVLKITIARCHPALPAGHWSLVSSSTPSCRPLAAGAVGAANDYLHPDYRHQLVGQAKHLLQAPERFHPTGTTP